MKRTQRLLNGLMSCGVALAMAYTLAAQAADQSTAKVVRLKGGARYKIGNSEWQQLKLGDVLHAGTLIQTGANRGWICSWARPLHRLPDRCRAKCLATSLRPSRIWCGCGKTHS